MYFLGLTFANHFNRFNLVMSLSIYVLSNGVAHFFPGMINLLRASQSCLVIWFHYLFWFEYYDTMISSNYIFSPKIHF